MARNPRGLNSYDHVMCYVGPLIDRKPLTSIMILIFGLGPIFWGADPDFRTSWNWESEHFQIWNLGEAASSTMSEKLVDEAF